MYETPRTAQEALVAARLLYPRSIGFQTAFVDGWRAGNSGRPVDACPYLHGSRRRARSGWRPVWRRIWLRGHSLGLQNRD